MGWNNYLKSCLRKLFVVFRRLFARQAASGARSKICRFIFQSNHYSTERRLPKPGAFLPRASRTQISMFFVDAIAEQKIWKIGDEVAGGLRGKPAQARAELLASTISSVEQCTLRIEPDPTTHPRHV